MTVWVREWKKLNGENKTGERTSERVKGTDRQRGRAIQQRLEHFSSLQIMTWHLVRFLLCIEGSSRGRGHMEAAEIFFVVIIYQYIRLVVCVPVLNEALCGYNDEYNEILISNHFNSLHFNCICIAFTFSQ